MVQPATVVMDGECGLCQRASHYGMRRAKPDLLRFVASQSDEGDALLARYGLQAAAADSMVAVVGERAFVRSAAVVQVAKRLRWPYRVQALVWLVPKPVRDMAYDQVSRRRRKPAGRRE